MFLLDILSDQGSNRPCRTVRAEPSVPSRPYRARLQNATPLRTTIVASRLKVLHGFLGDVSTGGGLAKSDHNRNWYSTTELKDRSQNLRDLSLASLNPFILQSAGPLLASSLAGVGVKDCDYNSLRGFNMNILEIQSINSITSKLRWK
ncbi:hypothetical protein E6O75_ATG10465 [Venturia nashicola]|uniref:Uncharacterized protein n=1 Tax=Venturia nashicola TaxID=86259 RepID=A0A4Z1NPV1_9PEZI|nr:hypothetical protein E6O75_ATG10465 [Venturia nashicola]